ncbi:MAG: hypothetical protein Q8P40_09145 [Nitrospirota bacterium]|nr:hypothetical protein [Nitrospirota bacterium]
MDGFFVRVGIDSTKEYGGWNAPYEPTNGRFAFIPIPEKQGLKKKLARYYNEFIPTLNKFDISLPKHLIGMPVHIDPDFENLTYGDHNKRAKQLSSLKSGDFIVFYAGLRSTNANTKRLVYAIIGFYFVKKIIRAIDLPKCKWGVNAHARRIIDDSDIIIFANKKCSGRLLKAIVIGEYRKRAYRVKKDYLKLWGGLKVKNGYIQRSGTLPKIKEPLKFIKWWERQNITLVHRNN